MKSLTDQFFPIQFHNVSQLKKINELNGYRLERFPPIILNSEQDERLFNSTGCELRFSTEAEEIQVELSALYHEGKVIVYQNEHYYGCFQLQMSEKNCLVLRNNTRLMNVDHGRRAEWRIVFCKDFCGVFCSIEPKQMLLEYHGYWSKTMLAYGSSLTHGSGAPLITQSYVHILATKRNYDILNKGMSGKAFCEKYVVDYLCEYNPLPDVFLLELGINMIGKYQTADFRKAMEYFYQRLKLLKATKVVVISPFWSYHDLEVEGISNSQSYREIMDEIFGSHKQDHMFYIDGKDVLEDNNFLQCDLLHPSPEGHVRLAYALDKKIGAFL